MILSIDGGATKTCSILFDENTEKVIGVGISGPSNFTTVPEETAVNDIEHTLRQIRKNSGVNPTESSHIIAGLAGIGDSSETTKIGTSMIKRMMGRTDVDVVNDGFVAYKMANLFEDGVVFAPGTGSVGYVQKDGVLNRVGGWGWFMGDEGSASWIGREAVRIAQRQSDGILKGNEFIELVENHFLGDFREIMGVLERERNKRQVALLSRRVIEMAYEGNEYALKIVNEAADYDASVINSMLANFKSCPKVSVLGGTMKAGSIIQDRIRNSVKCHIRFYYGYHVAIGGIIIKLNKLGIKVEEEFRDDMIAQLNLLIENEDKVLRKNSLGF